MQPILSMLRKEFKQIFRDKPMMAIIFVIPIVQLFILAFAITVDVKHIKLMIVDLDRSPISREIARAFSHSEQFDVVGSTDDLNGIKERFQDWSAQMALVIPANFSRELRRGLKPAIGLTVDGVDGNSAGVALGYAQGILQQFGLDRALQPTNRGNLRSARLIAMRERLWYNPNLNSQQYMIPGIAVVLLTILPMMLSAMSLVREKEIGTLEQLMVTPLSKWQLLAGKIVPFLILSYVELAILLVCSVVFFDVVLEGSVLLLAFLAFLYLFTTLGLGVFVSTITTSQQQAMFVAWFIMVFMLLMSGFFIPIANMPALLQKLTYLNPMRYFISIVRDIFQKGSSLQFLYVDAVPMTVFGLAIFIMSVVKFRKRVG